MTYLLKTLIFATHGLTACTDIEAGQAFLHIPNGLKDATHMICNNIWVMWGFAEGQWPLGWIWTPNSFITHKAKLFTIFSIQFNSIQFYTILALAIDIILALAIVWTQMKFKKVILFFVVAALRYDVEQFQYLLLFVLRVLFVLSYEKYSMCSLSSCIILLCVLCTSACILFYVRDCT